ncbi:unnamed protein product [Eruca vesicaria subsp. sativa]|uniref:Polygalacturonase n=1 Tax=Eruca vesicaria subsp. sativa TaxID=29727 RepID=A0ABC8KSI9_ERUVS|nr:unnamed protein product [Eruca vesicaria subsp. sativa]
MKMSSLFFVLLCLFQISKLGFCVAESVHKANNSGYQRCGFISVTSFGAVGDGKTDDTQAFLKAWDVVCNGGNNTKLLVPLNNTFMLKPLMFAGPCKSSSIAFVIRGNLVAPGYTWSGGKHPKWISFKKINGLVVSGGGTLDGRGSVWWRHEKAQNRPTAMHFSSCDGLKMFNLRHLNSPRNHISLSRSENITISRLNMTAPSDSPNTDGIDIANCKGVDIRDSVISTGDDCIAVNKGSSYINITGLFCGPGHGISVGSLGVNGEFATVEEVRVKNCTFTKTKNGVRIKTYQNGLGYARKITFEDITMVDSGNPIIIEQNYHNKGKFGKVSFEYSNGRGVKVSDVRYSRINGSSASDQAVTFNCNANLGCENIVMEHVNLVSATTGHEASASCINVHGSFSDSLIGCIKYHKIRAKMKKSSLFFVLLCLFQISKLGFCSVHKANNNENNRHGFISVTSFGAVGDGKTDDTQAFLKAWEAVCNGGSNTNLLVPQGKTFMLKPLTFEGPCKSPSISFLIRGNLVAPGYTWSTGTYPAWINFDSINGLVVKGGGTLDGRGSMWWGHVQNRPTAMHFNNCDGLRMFNLQHLNSPRNHVSLSCSKNIIISGQKMIAPGDSPNTDGIDISNCMGVDIRDSTISTGDDCIAINRGSSYINITGIFCGPGHGISVGSLGENGEFATVEEVSVKNCTLTNTMNGVRIKTYQNGLGYARKISFEDIKMVDSKNPIIIEQNYHNKGTSGEVSFEYGNSLNCGGKSRFYKTESGEARGVKVSNVRYSRIYGSSASDEAITLNCDADLGCEDIVMDHVNIVSATAGHVVSASCKNVHGSHFDSLISCFNK